MGEIMPKRVIALREGLGLSQARLGSTISTSQASIQRIESGETLHPRKLLALAAALRTSPEYLTGETDDPSPGAADEAQRGWRLARATEHDNTVEIVVSDVAYGMGGAFVDEVGAHVSVQRFPQTFIRQFTQSPFGELYFAIGIGDSMAPTIHHSDLVLIDRGQERLRVSDQLWAVAAGEIGMIKRVRVLPDGTVQLVSDNPDVSDYTVAQDELRLIGRVVAVVKKV